MNGLNAASAVVFLIGLLGSLAAFRVASWRHQESQYWAHLDVLDHFDEAPEDAPEVLLWVQKNPPSLLEQLGPWRPPHWRRRRATS